MIFPSKSMFRNFRWQTGSEVKDMIKNRVWNDLIKPTILAYIIACAIPASIAGAYYIYSRYF